jgi:hypothetical protein
MDRQEDLETMKRALEDMADRPPPKVSSGNALRSHARISIKIGLDMAETDTRAAPIASFRTWAMVRTSDH